MKIDLTPFYRKIEELAKLADATVERVKTEYPEQVRCIPGCADCCHALFDLTLAEALYINHQFALKFQGEKKSELLEKANRADRQAFKLKKKAYQDYKKGKKETEIVLEMANERIECPLLSAEDLCELYDHRPITCRFYGIPTLIGGMTHTCGRSEFEEGVSYPTVKLDRIQTRLMDISREIVREIDSKYGTMGEMLVPLSMALLTDYTEEYLGIVKEVEKEKTEG
ncbi:MAG: YkgJ family cysteine cluster protein [Thermodesulfobacteriota bacterium]